MGLEKKEEGWDMDVTAKAVGEMASRICGMTVDERVAGLWLERVIARCGEDADGGSVLLAAARYAAADTVECDAGFAEKVSAAGLGLEGRSADEVAASLRRSAARVIAPYLNGGGGVVRA